MPKVRYIQRHVPLSSQTTVLDVGCGNGFFTHPFSELSPTVGLDFSAFMLSINPCRPLVQGSALALPFGDGAFDLVFCSNLLHHMDDPVAAVSEMGRVSRRYVVLSEPNRDNPLMFLFSAIRREERYGLRFSLSYPRRLVKAAGLSVVAAVRLGLVLPNKTPLALLPLLRRIEREGFPLNAYNVVIARVPR